MFPQLPFCNLPNSPIFFTLKTYFIFIHGFVSVAHTIPESNNPFFLSLSLSLLYCPPSSLLSPILSLSLYILVSYRLLSEPMKKIKGLSPLAPSAYAVYEDPRHRFKHHTLLQDYHDLQKETEVVKETLERAKQKKLTLLAEVRFLRRRYKYLTRKQSPNLQPKHGLVQSQKQDPPSRNNVKERKSSRKTAALHGVKDAVLQNSSPVIDLNVKERTSAGKEATARNTIPVFDLNQISREEEEELNGGQLRFEEPVKSSMRIVNDEQQNDMKLSVCRNIGNGTSRAGKRKITWQDQVALKV